MLAAEGRKRWYAPASEGFPRRHTRALHAPDPVLHSTASSGAKVTRATCRVHRAIEDGRMLMPSWVYRRRLMSVAVARNDCRMTVK